ncbi:MAG: S8 family serine peptidase, partial [Anaerolineae bacterium]
MKRRKIFALLTVLMLLTTLVPVTSGATQAPAPRSAYKLPDGPAPERLAVEDRVAAVSYDEASKGEMVQMWVELTDQPLALAQDSNLARLDAKQTAVARQAQALGAVELARVKHLFNAVAVRVPAESVAALRAIPGVKSVTPVVDGVVDLINSVPWIGAVRAQEELGYTGEGVNVAIIDTGIDYTHAAFGGPGTVEAYAQAVTGTMAAVITDTFAAGWLWPDPRIKVITGTDFVGPFYDGDAVTELSPDPDPIDDGPGAGHGTHVASIAAGLLVTDATVALVGQGVAPDANLFAYKVCSSISTSCSGIAMVQALEEAYLDGADVVNMSIGAIYGGGYESYATTVAATTAAEQGILIATSCGNSGNLPYITGAPGASNGVLATAASNAGGQVGVGLRVDAPESIADTYLGFDFDWAPDPVEDITAPVVYVGLGCSVDDYPPGLVVTDTIALILRGGCRFDQKVLNAELKGAVAGVIFTANPGDAPFAGSGNPIVTIPGMMISNQDGTLISNTLSSGVVTATIGPDIVVPRPEIADVMASFSSRGPRIWDNGFKPNVTAPGAGIAAAGAGTGTGTSVRGGTSMASPHNAGTMALMREAYPDMPVERIYNAIMNTAQPELYQDVNGGTRAPVARQGAGLIQTDAALETTTIAWDDANDMAHLSFGYQAVSDTWVMTKTVRVWNTRDIPGGTPNLYRTYDIAFTNVYTDDEGAGVMVKIEPERIWITDGMSKTFDVGVYVDAAGLKEWYLNAGALGSNGDAMTDIEFDGFVTIEEVWPGTGIPEVEDEINLPLYLLPHKASDVMAEPLEINLDSYVDTSGVFTLTNSAAYTGTTGIYAWMIDDPTADVVTGTLDVDMVGVSAYDSPYGPMFEFAIVAAEARAHPYIARFNVHIDVNGDGMEDYILYNTDLSRIPGFEAYQGQSYVFLRDLAAGATYFEFYNITNLNSKVMRFLLPAADIGLTSDM